MKHTYLLQEGKWQAFGEYTDETNTTIQARGETITVHHPTLWIHEGTMTLLLEPPVEFSNRYEIVPLKENSTLTTWLSYNPALGKLQGTFVITPGSIFSSYQSECRTYRGVEHLVQLDENTYQATGTLLKGDQRLSSWVMEIRRVLDS